MIKDGAVEDRVKLNPFVDLILMCGEFHQAVTVSTHAELPGLNMAH